MRAEPSAAHTLSYTELVAPRSPLVAPESPIVVPAVAPPKAPAPRVVLPPAVLVPASDACGGGAKRVQKAVLRERESPWVLMRRLGIAAPTIEKLKKAFRGRVNLARLAPGHEIRAGFDAKERLLWLRHRPGLREAYCARRGPKGQFAARDAHIPVKRRLEVVEGVLMGRSWAEALVAAGEARGLGVRVGALFPFGEELARFREEGRPVGFRLLVEKRYVEDSFFAYGAIETIEVSDGDEVRRAFRFPRPGAEDAYYGEDLRPLRPRWLAPPVLHASVTSTYGPRRHPIRRRWKMHRGIDYGAAAGEPVFAVATGTVTFAARRRALGRLVVIEHPGELTTRYAHLRRFAAGIRSGKRVEAGDLIGFVGSTGMSTGPHLHFETLVRGRHMNPKRYRPPAAPALEDEDEVALEARIRALQERLAGDVS